MSFNWIDWVILAVIFYYIVEGWQTGLVYLIVNLLSFLGSLWLAVKYHGLIGNFLLDKFGLPSVWSQVAGYLVVGIVSEAMLAEIFFLFIRRLPKSLFNSKTNKWLGAILSAVNGLIIIAFFLLIILALPLRGSIKKDIKQSVLGSKIVVLADTYGGSLKSSLDQVTHEAIQFLTVKPQSNEKINLDVAPTNNQLTVDEKSEKQMVDLVNGERAKVGVGQLSLDTGLRTVARNYSREMFLERYFSHIDPQGHDAAYRAQKAGIDFTIIGENLAYAPDLATAHQGLMNSEGHRHNILDPQFHRVGIGIIDSGIYGEMFTQLFVN